LIAENLFFFFFPSDFIISALTDAMSFGAVLLAQSTEMTL